MQTQTEPVQNHTSKIGAHGGPRAVSMCVLLYSYYYSVSVPSWIGLQNFYNHTNHSRYPSSASSSSSSPPPRSDESAEESAAGSSSSLLDIFYKRATRNNAPAASPKTARRAPTEDPSSVGAVSSDSSSAFVKRLTRTSTSKAKKRTVRARTAVPASAPAPLQPPTAFTRSPVLDHGSTISSIVREGEDVRELERGVPGFPLAEEPSAEEPRFAAEEQRYSLDASLGASELGDSMMTPNSTGEPAAPSGSASPEAGEEGEKVES